MSPVTWLLVVDPEVSERIEESVREILDNPPYRSEPGLLERLLGWLLGRGVGGGLFDPGLMRFFEMIMIAVGLAAIGWMVWLVIRRLRTGTFGRPSHPGRPRVGHRPVEPSASEWLRQARAHAAAGRNLEAVRAAYRAVVAQLVNLDAVSPAPGATVGTHREQISDSQVLEDLQARGFSDASDIFEGVYYASRSAGSDDAAVVIETAQRLGVGK